MNNNNTKPCRVCGKEEFTLFKESNIKENLKSESFAITNFDYGKTGTLHKCIHCNFIQCFDLENVIEYYTNLVDEEYEDSRDERYLQELQIVKLAKEYKAGGSLLDIGAGSGILVEAANANGFNAVGIEPSAWLVGKAKGRSLNVIEGLFPCVEIEDRKFDVITLIDVIEHVEEPLDLVKNIKKYLNDDGVFIMITPDVSSLAARILGVKWWHYRVAHIGYFNKHNFNLLAQNGGFENSRLFRNKWYFTLGYLWVRFNSFLPAFIQIKPFKWMYNCTIPLNLRDSWLGVYEKQ